MIRLENPRYFLEKYYFLLIIFTILFSILLIIVKCFLKLDIFDKFLYVEESHIDNIFDISNYSLEYLIIL